tara:strand:- start:2232 stop:2783 length:552 start_codon:yes stop_codon:yes gene_type:complete
MKKIKIGIIGTTCSGKTTLVFGLIHRLRKEGYNCEGVIGTDKVYPFNKKKLDTDDEAQVYVMLQQAFLETRKMLQDNIDILITDRSLLDFFSYYKYCMKSRKPYYRAMKGLVEQWIKTYDIIFYLRPLKYVNDGTRPSEKFRREVDEVIKKDLKMYNSKNVYIVTEFNRLHEVYRKLKRSVLK